MKWEKIGEKTVYESFKKLSVWKFKMPDGTIHEYDITITGNVCAIFPLTKDGKIIMVSQFRPGPGKIMLEFPAGFIDEGETPSEAAKRELMEETGFEGELKYLGATYPIAYSTEVRHHFIALQCEKNGGQRLDDNEFIEVKEVNMKELKRILKEGNLTNSETGYKALEWLRENSNLNKKDT